MLLCALSNPEHKRARNSSFAALSVLDTVTLFICWVQQSEVTESNEPGGWWQRERWHLKDYHSAGNLQQSTCISDPLCWGSLPRAIHGPHHTPVELALPVHTLPDATAQGSDTASAARNDIKHRPSTFSAQNQKKYFSILPEAGHQELIPTLILKGCRHLHLLSVQN